MIIDARGRSLRGLFTELKEIFASQRGIDVFIEILLDTHNSAKGVKAFADMSGFKTEVTEKEGYYIVRITDIPCCV